MLQGPPAASRGTRPWRDETSKRKNHLQEDTSKPSWKPRCSSLAGIAQSGLSEKGDSIYPSISSVILSKPHCTPCPSLFSSSSCWSSFTLTAHPRSTAISSSKTRLKWHLPHSPHAESCHDLLLPHPSHTNPPKYC